MLTDRQSISLDPLLLIGIINIGSLDHGEHRIETEVFLARSQKRGRRGVLR